MSSPSIPNLAAVRLMAILAFASAFGLLPLAPGRAVAAEVPVVAEKNPPGDIPDSQVFIDYKSPLGFSMQVPEGWSRTDRAGGALFLDKYDLIDVGLATAAAAPTVASVAADQAKTLLGTGRAVKIASIKSVTLAGGAAVVIQYSANSDPNAVTRKQIRLERARYFIFGNGKLVTLDMAAPLGADNVDQWALMSKSVRIQ